MTTSATFGGTFFAPSTGGRPQILAPHTTDAFSRVTRGYLDKCLREDIDPRRASLVLRAALWIHADEADVSAYLDLMGEVRDAEGDPDGYFYRHWDGPSSPDGRAEWSIEHAYILRLEADEILARIVVR